MNIKSEIEIKLEELDSVREELDSVCDYQQSYEIFSDHKAIFALPECGKKEQFHQNETVESEFKEILEKKCVLEDKPIKKCVLEDEPIKNNVKISENKTLIEQKSSTQHTKEFSSLKNISSLLKKIEEKDVEVCYTSNEEEFFAKLLTSKFPLVRINILSDEELKTLISDAGQGEKGSKVKSLSRKLKKRSTMHDKSNKNNPEGLLSCRYCNLIFKDKKGLKDHMQTTHSSNKKVKCPHCAYESKNNSLLKIHLLTHSKIKLFNCCECSYACNNKGNLKSHLLTHGNIKVYKCSECSYECNEKGNLNRHKLTHGNIKLYKCSECCYEANRRDNLKIHMLKHANVKLFKCSHCSYESNNISHLKEHILKHANVKLFRCSDCSYECNNISLLKGHMLIHTKVKLFKCSHCSFECNHKGSLKRHIFRRHVNLFKGSQRDHEYSDKKSHNKMHKNVFKCSKCNYECKLKRQLKLHMLNNHENIKLFKCSHCSYGSNQKGHLNRHMLKHSSKNR